jgi:hypothetical protein
MKLAAALAFLLLLAPRPALAEDLLPKHITPQAQVAIKKGLDFLAKSHSEDGSFMADRDGQAYPMAMTALAGMAFLANGNTPSRGPYADHVGKIVEFLTSNVQPGGLITGPTQEQGYSMYGHGFSLMFLSSCYGMETNDKMRDRMKKIINNGIKLTASASSNGGWCYTPGTGDEGSVTVTQIQGLRAASNAGFTVPKGAIEGGTISNAAARRREAFAIPSVPLEPTAHICRFPLPPLPHSTTPANMIPSSPTPA